MLHVFPIRILAFSGRFGEFVVFALSKMKPKTEIKTGILKINEIHTYLHRGKNLSASHPPFGDLDVL
jgi:hypothetical protein